MPKYNLIEYSNNYSNTSGSLWQFKRDEIEDVDLTADGNHIPKRSSSFTYKSNLITNRNGVKIAVLLKYFLKLWRSLEMPLINCNVELPLTWDLDFDFYNNGWKYYVPIDTLSTEDNSKLSKLLSERLKRPVYRNKYKVIPKNESIKKFFCASYQVVKRLFVLAYRDRGGANRVTADSHRRYFLPRVEIKNQNIETDGRNFNNHPINNQETNDLIKQYDELRKVSTGQGDDYATGCLLDFGYFEKKLQINCSWFK